MADPDLTVRRKLAHLLEVVKFRPAFTVGIVVLGTVSAVLEGIGMAFIIPIIRSITSSGSDDPSGIHGLFQSAYEVLGVPFTLESIIVGVSLVLLVRYSASFAVSWLRAILRTGYVVHLRDRAFRRALDTEIAYFDERGSDEILNVIITETFYAGNVILRAVRLMENVLLAAVYFLVAIYLAPVLTLVTTVVFGGATLFIRTVLESGYSVGDKVGKANEDLQEIVQAGTQGIRDVKLYRLQDELLAGFGPALEEFRANRVRAQRNVSIIGSYYRYVAAITVFVLIYGALRFTSIGLGELGLFLFAMFRLGPTVSRINDEVYRVESELPHLVRSQTFIDELDGRLEGIVGSRAAPNPVREITFDEVELTYTDGEPAIGGVSFEAERGEFVAFAGPSGAGKSSIVSLLTRMYKPDGGEIRANGVRIDDVDLAAWRGRLAVVRQDPYIFNTTLLRNVTVGIRSASMDEVRRVCAIARVDEFVDGLDDGYETVLGDAGVRLSGGQRQRVAIARALLCRPDVLVFDEATSDLDSRLEAEIQSRIESMDEDRITITIAHRLSTIRNADTIHVMRNGTIVESGTHEDLLAQGGVYAEMYAMQRQEQ